jgi:flagellar motor switch protein FliN/FliY
MAAQGSQMLEWLGYKLAEAIAISIEGMIGDAADVQFKINESPEFPDIFWWQQTFSVNPQAPVFAGAPSQTWEGIGKRFLAAAGLDGTAPAEIRNSYQEILNQAFASFCQSLTVRVHDEVTTVGGRAGAPSNTRKALIEITFPDAPALPMLCAFDPQFVRSLEALVMKEAGAAAPQEQEQAAAPEEAPSTQPRTDTRIDRLLDVELPVSISFGSAQLSLKDVLKLNIGSIVELSRAVNEPVDLIVNNCVIARGEVVVIEGNYGIRTLQIVSRQERLRSLR